MTDHDAFVEAICERPDDDFPRLHYADWLDERGDPRGEFIRVQCELETWKNDSAERSLSPEGIIRHGELKRREQELLSVIGPHGLPNRARWLGEMANRVIQNPETLADLSMFDILAKHPIIGLLTNSEFRRGFIARITLPHDAFLEHAAAMFCAAPIEAVTLSDKHPDHRGINLRPVHAGWFCPGVSWRPGQDDLHCELWGLLGAGKVDGNWKWYDTAEAANADLSAACVKLGRERGAKLKKERVKS